MLIAHKIPSDFDINTAGGINAPTRVLKTK